MDTDNYSWENFSISFYYPTNIETLFKYWATKKGLESFFIENIDVGPMGKSKAPEELIQSGDIYSWKWRHGYSINGEFKEVIENKKVSFTFGNMLVEVSFFNRDGKTLCHLFQKGISDDSMGKVMSHLNCRSCWVFFMTNLKSVLVNNTDLRDEEPELTSAYEVGYVPKEINH